MKTEPDYHSLFTVNVQSLYQGTNNQSTGHCPFHDDRRKSFSVNLETGLWKCFAGCGSGNAYQFAQRLGIDPTPYMDGDKTRFPKKSIVAPNKPRNGDVPHSMGVEITSEHKQKAHEYHKYLISNFDTLCSGLPWTIEAVKQTYTGYDSESKRYVFLHLDSERKAINIKWHKDSDSQPFSLKGYGKCRLYPLHLIKDYTTPTPLIFCEGEKDVITLLSQGFKAVTSTTGADSIPRDLSPLKNIRKIMIVYDNDQAGRIGSGKLAKRLKDKFPEMKVFIHHWHEGLPDKYDITDYFNNNGTVEEFNQMLSKATEFELDVETPEFNLTDAGNAELLIHLHGHEIRFNHTEGGWYIWNGQFWERDVKKQIGELAIDTARHRQSLAVNVNDPDDKKKLFNFGLQSESKIKIGFCLELAKGLKPVATVATDWNKDPYLLQFTNGLLNLETMEFEPGLPDRMISKTTRLKYDPGASCPNWVRAIGEIMNNNPNLVEFLKRSIGYSLTGDISDQCFFLLYGSGANGKSVTLEILRSLLGDYAIDSPFSAFERRFGNSQSNDLARLNSTRLVTSAESGSSKRLDEERLKSITGGDPITARFLHKEFFTYNPQFKLWLAVNSLPKVEDFSHGFWRRVRLIPFDAQFKGEKADSRIIDKLKPELSGIMNWALAGFQEWKSEGLNPPTEVINATKDYQNESDIVAEFLDGFVIYDQNESIKASVLYLKFKEWHDEEYSEKPITQTTFGRRVSLVTGIKSDKVSGFKYYVGIGIVDHD